MHRLSWAEINGLVALLAERAAHDKIDCIVGVMRAGMIPAVMLSHITGIRHVSTIAIVRTRSDAIDAAKDAPVCHGILNPEALAGRRVLVVDDIIGKGLTMTMARDALIAAGATPVLATLVVNRENLGHDRFAEVADHWGCVVRGWVIFPWDREARGDA